MFLKAPWFNGDVTMWYVEKVADMSSMFFFAKEFNQKMTNWRTNSLKSMDFMVRNLFEARITDWIPPKSQLTSCLHLQFNSAYKFDGDVSFFETSRVTHTTLMFFNASSFNGRDLSGWNTSQVTDMFGMFALSSFNGDISAWKRKESQICRRCFYMPRHSTETVDGMLVTSPT